MRRVLKIDPRVLTIAEHTSSWYESERFGYGDLFRQELDKLFARILEHPEMYQAINDRYRRAHHQLFSIVVVYRITSDAIEIVGLVRQEASPSAIKRLISPPLA